MRAGQGGHTDLFSAAVAVLCTAVGTILFFTTTAPALEERAWLHGVETDQVRLRDALGQQLADLRSRAATLASDPQTLLLAIDDAGLTPAELLGEAVPGMPAVPAWAPRAR